MNDREDNSSSDSNNSSDEGDNEYEESEEQEQTEMTDSSNHQPSSLCDLLESGVESFEQKKIQEDQEQQQQHQQFIPQTFEQQQEMQLELVRQKGICIECEDQIATVKCVNCDESYCNICYTSLHRKGNRVNHQRIQLQKTENKQNDKMEEQEIEKHTLEGIQDPSQIGIPRNPSIHIGGAPDFLERAKFIPVRLQLKERKLLRLLEGALVASEYTDKVDILTFQNKARRTYAQVVEICSTLSGVVVAADYAEGQKIVNTRSFKDHYGFFQNIFEVGRRYKVMNPEKMRSEYGKLMYMLQDSVNPEVQSLLEFSCSKPIFTVFDYLKSGGADKLLSDPNVEIATRAIATHTLDGDKKERFDIRSEVKKKEAAVEYLSRKYSTSRIDGDGIKMALYSLGDNGSFLLTTRDPVEKMIRYLKRYFRPDRFENGYSLAIEGGREGARLTHAHDRQYYYCLQSLTLWREVSNEMFKLWYQADQDLLDGGINYTLKDTGQGVHRVQAAPRIEKTMRQILYSVQQEVGVENWVGSSVIHLGDHNVPNALMFIDKYTQVSRILNPIVLTLERIDELVQDPHIDYFIQKIFNGPDILKKDILLDFFKFGFDGSGADNFFDAGSCIDGRLTSAWNWCSKLHEKQFFAIFKLTGFTGFDGGFQN